MMFLLRRNERRSNVYIKKPLFHMYNSPNKILHRYELNTWRNNNK